jgi:hypothetical protein
MRNVRWAQSKGTACLGRSVRFNAEILWRAAIDIRP